MNWLVNGNIPSRINGKEETKATLTVDKMSFFTMFHAFGFTSDKKFLYNFWNIEKSPYVAEKKLKGQQIHLNYSEAMRSRITIYWLPRLKDRTIGSITIDDVKDIFNDPVVKKLAHKTINSIISALTIPMKWAYYNRLTRNNCFDGIIKCSQKGKTRKIFTMEQAAAVFKIDWENDTAKLANAVAMCTGMRRVKML